MHFEDRKGATHSRRTISAAGADYSIIPLAHNLPCSRFESHLVDALLEQDRFKRSEKEYLDEIPTGSLVNPTQTITRKYVTWCRTFTDKTHEYSISVQKIGETEPCYRLKIIKHGREYIKDDLPARYADETIVDAEYNSSTGQGSPRIKSLVNDFEFGFEPPTPKTDITPARSATDSNNEAAQRLIQTILQKFEFYKRAMDAWILTGRRIPCDNDVLQLLCASPSEVAATPAYRLAEIGLAVVEKIPTNIGIALEERQTVATQLREFQEQSYSYYLDSPFVGDFQPVPSDKLTAFETIKGALGDLAANNKKCTTDHPNILLITKTLPVLDGGLHLSPYPTVKAVESTLLHALNSYFKRYGGTPRELLNLCDQTKQVFDTVCRGDSLSTKAHIKNVYMRQEDIRKIKGVLFDTIKDPELDDAIMNTIIQMLGNFPVGWQYHRPRQLYDLQRLIPSWTTSSTAETQIRITRNRVIEGSYYGHVTTTTTVDTHFGIPIRSTNTTRTKDIIGKYTGDKYDVEVCHQGKTFILDEETGRTIGRIIFDYNDILFDETDWIENRLAQEKKDS